MAKQNGFLKRTLSLVLAVQMLLSNVPVGAFAADYEEGLCPHHEAHTAECGYGEGAEAVPCTHSCEEELCEHIHDELCGYLAAVDASPLHIFLRGM